jgi:hypothetical protein
MGELAPASRKEVVWLWGNLHPGEPTGGKVVDYLQANPCWGVHATHVHPEAAELGVRSLHGSEIGGLFTDEVVDCNDPSKLNRDQLAVQRLLLDEGEEVSYWLIADLHNGTLPGSNCLAIGDNTDIAVLGLARRLGLRNVVHMPGYPLYDLLPLVGTVEIDPTDPNNPLLSPEYWRRQLQYIARLGYEDLRRGALYDYPDLNYYRFVDLGRVNGDGSVNQERWECIRQLEGREQDREARAFEPVDIPPDVRKIFELGDGEICMGMSWDDHNYSEEAPDLLGYRDDGSARLRYFGSLAVRLPEPVITGWDTLHFSRSES